MRRFRRTAVSKEGKDIRLPLKGGGRTARPRKAEGRPTDRPSFLRRRGKKRVRRGRSKLGNLRKRRAKPQRIVTTRTLCRLQHPVPSQSRLQRILNPAKPEIVIRPMLPRRRRWSSAAGGTALSLRFRSGGRKPPPYPCVRIA